MQSPLPPPQPGPINTSFYHQAATICGFSPLIAFGINFLSIAVRAATPAEMKATVEMVVASLVLFVIAVGLGLGVISLFGIRKYGKAGIFGKAMTGISINLAFIVLALIPLFFRR